MISDRMDIAFKSENMDGFLLHKMVRLHVRWMKSLHYFLEKVPLKQRIQQQISRYHYRYPPVDTPSLFFVVLKNDKMITKMITKLLTRFDTKIKEWINID